MKLFFIFFGSLIISFLIFLGCSDSNNERSVKNSVNIENHPEQSDYKQIESITKANVPSIEKDKSKTPDTDTSAVTINKNDDNQSFAVVAYTSNELPVANAGVDETVSAYDDVIFNGSSSSDDGSISKYVWSEGTTELSTFMIFTKDDFSVGTHRITLSVTDNQGASSSDEVIITVNAPSNLLPTASNQFISTDENVDVNITLSGVDGNGDDLIYTVETNTTHGTISGKAPNLTYTPNVDYSGIDSFTFKVNDGTVDSAEAAIKIMVNAIFHNGKRYKAIKSPYTGEVWLDRNLGANRVCRDLNDSECFGYYYQWGRGNDGHEKLNSTVSSVQAKDLLSTGSDFIIKADWVKADSSRFQRSLEWSKTNASSVCPLGYRVPTSTELEDELTYPTAVVSNNVEAFKNFLKLPSAGHRNISQNSMILEHEKIAYIWTSSTMSGNPSFFYISGEMATKANNYPSYGFSVRCIKDTIINL